MTPYQLSQLPKSSLIVNEMVDQMNAVRLAQFNARTSTICALTGLSNKKVRLIITAISNRNPQKGRGVENLDDYINNKKHRRHVSYIVQTYRNGIELGLSHIESIIQTYMMYQATLSAFSDTRTYVDIDHAFFIIQETNKRTDFDMNSCNSCKSRYFYYKYEIPSVCPFCSDKRDMQPQQDIEDDETIKRKVA